MMTETNNQRIVRTAKCQPTVEPVKDTIIYITEDLPLMSVDLDEWDAYCDVQAKQLEEALIVGLPGGVYDRLFRQMAARKAGHFRVAHKQEGE